MLTDGNLANIHILALGRQSSDAVRLSQPLSHHGYSVILVEDLETFMGSARTVAPQYAIIDLDHFQGQADEAMQTVLREPILASTPILLLSSSQSEATRISQADALGRTLAMPNSIEFPFFFNQLKESLRKRRKVSVEFDLQNCRKAVVYVGGKIVSTNENGFGLKASARIAPSSRVQVISAALEKIGLMNCMFVRTTNLAPAQADQTFVNEISIIGINPEAAVHLNRMAKESRL